MASLRASRRLIDDEHGFATAAAMMISLGIALIATALMATAIEELHAAKADMSRDRAIYALTGLHEQADLTLLTAGLAPRLRWTLSSSVGQAQVLAEAETPKMALAAAGNIDFTTLKKLGVADAGALHGRLSALKMGDALGPQLDTADASPVWRACARSLISAYGAAKAPPTLRSSAPVSDITSSHLGDVWRIRIRSGEWVDDRMVRITGEPRHPAAVVARQFYRLTGKEILCDALFAG